MLSKFYKINDAMYYFGGSDDGSMKTGSQSIKDNTGDTYKFYFYTKDQDKTKYTTPEEGNQLKKGAGVVGNQSNKLYYYGLLLTADDYKYQVAKVGGYEFIINSNGSKLSTTTSSGGLILALQRAITTARPEGRYRKHCYWLRYKAVLLESSLLESSACSLIYFCTASSVILPIVST